MNEETVLVVVFLIEIYLMLCIVIWKKESAYSRYLYFTSRYVRKNEVVY